MMDDGLKVLNIRTGGRRANNALELTGLSRAEIEVRSVIAVCLLARLVLQTRPVAQLHR